MVRIIRIARKKSHMNLKKTLNSLSDIRDGGLGLNLEDKSLGSRMKQGSNCPGENLRGTKELSNQDL